MKAEDRKIAVNGYKERKTEAGIYAVRCLASGAVWVGQAPNLSTIRNRLWFTLRQGSSRHRSLQDAWRLHGAEAFMFEILERLEEEELDYVRDKLLQARLAHWSEEIGADRI